MKIAVRLVAAPWALATGLQFAPHTHVQVQVNVQSSPAQELTQERSKPKWDPWAKGLEISNGQKNVFWFCQPATFYQS